MAPLEGIEDEIHCESVLGGGLLVDTGHHRHNTSSRSLDFPLQANVDSVIAKHGGEQTAWNKVSWEQGAVKLQIADPSVPLAAASCASSRYCVFSQASYLGSQLSYSTCPATHTSFAALGGPVRSIANKLSQRTVRAYASSTLKHTLPSGTSVASTSGITKITCA